MFSILSILLWFPIHDLLSLFDLWMFSMAKDNRKQFEKKTWRRVEDDQSLLIETSSCHGFLSVLANYRFFLRTTTTQKSIISWFRIIILILTKVRLLLLKEILTRCYRKPHLVYCRTVFVFGTATQKIDLAAPMKGGLACSLYWSVRIVSKVFSTIGLLCVTWPIT